LPQVQDKLLEICWEGKDVLALVCLIHGLTECHRILGKRLVVSIVLICNEFLTIAMLLVISRSTIAQEPFEVIVYLCQQQTLDLGKNDVGIPVFGDMFTSQKLLDCCQIQIVMQEQGKLHVNPIVID
jgi:hypothetical protein